ncbi:MAG TPA: isocitrate lyase/phosphoenolpyruvate mutase family protein [Steroidobacteraceae bacterium]|nr:isocitrate lyase/phosphoenolpyruvate mutase family protein [Steroidobacteraceae bacterium]HNS27480.1 isocitrate lyase/phosphoenolpyruvate mutase family protein [Steroidobacteraceae bacterium]
MSTTTAAHRIAAARETFRALHARGCFVLANPWDIGGVRRAEKLGYKAIASTSAGFAWSLGRNDNEASRDEVLAHLTALCHSTMLPVNADFEDGFAEQPEGVAENVRLAVATGVAGLSIEDRRGIDLYPIGPATERIRAARQAIDRSGENVLLVGRSEGLLLGNTTIDTTVERLIAYAAAGADCVFAPGIRSITDIRSLVAAVAPTPVNVLLMDASMSVAELAEAGVRRVSVGAAFAKAAWAAYEHAARSVIEAGHLPRGN